MSAPVRTIRSLAGASIVLGPLTFLLGGVLAPPAMHTSGEETIAANVTAAAGTNAAHLVMFMAASFLLPVSAVALAWLAFASRPWLATIGGILGVLGWLPFSALTALDDVAFRMASLPQPGSFAVLYERFGYGSVMNTYLIVYIIGHLLAYVVLGVALWRGQVIAAWAGWALIASSPVTVAMFVLPGNPVIVGTVGIGLLVVGSVPAALRMFGARGTSAGGSIA